MATSTDWIVEGAEVAEYTRRDLAYGLVTLTTIERVTATQIVLANGRRYNRARLRPVGGDYSVELRSAADPTVVGALAAKAACTLRASVDELFRNGRLTTGPDAQALMAAIQERVAAVQAELDQLLAGEKGQATGG